MRLALSEIKTILKLKNKIFGENYKIYLFGSRVNDDKKGGDIDLYIKTDVTDNLLHKKIEFLTGLQQEFGEQKIDVIFSYDKNRAIEIEANRSGIELNLDKIKLQKYFNECDNHLQRIEEAYADIKEIIPLTADRYKHLTKDEVQAIDQYIFRFAKLQDTMGDKIFKLIIQQYEQNNIILPFIDILNKLEKIGFIDSAKEWIYLRKIRNEISHGYDDEPEEMSQAINQVVNQKEIIKIIYLKLQVKYVVGRVKC